MKLTTDELKKFGLNDLELEIVAWMMEGLKAGQIADKMRITEEAVRQRTQNIFSSVGVSDPLELVLFVAEKSIRTAEPMRVVHLRSQSRISRAASS